MLPAQEGERPGLRGVVRVHPALNPPSPSRSWRLDVPGQRVTGLAPPEAPPPACGWLSAPCVPAWLPAVCPSPSVLLLTDASQTGHAAGLVLRSCPLCRAASETTTFCGPGVRAPAPGCWGHSAVPSSRWSGPQARRGRRCRETPEVPGMRRDVVLGGVPGGRAPRCTPRGHSSPELQGPLCMWLWWPGGTPWGRSRPSSGWVLGVGRLVPHPGSPPKAGPGVQPGLRTPAPARQAGGLTEGRSPPSRGGCPPGPARGSVRAPRWSGRRCGHGTCPWVCGGRVPCPERLHPSVLRWGSTLSGGRREGHRVSARTVRKAETPTQPGPCLWPWWGPEALSRPSPAAEPLVPRTQVRSPGADCEPPAHRLCGATPVFGGPALAPCGNPVRAPLTPRCSGVRSPTRREQLPSRGPPSDRCH